MTFPHTAGSDPGLRHWQVHARSKQPDLHDKAKKHLKDTAWVLVIKEQMCPPVAWQRRITNTTDVKKTLDRAGGEKTGVRDAQE